MTACEIELYANFAVPGGAGESERRQRAVQAAMGAATNPTAAAVRQSVRVLAHTDKFRPPELSRGAKREHGQAAAAVRRTTRPSPPAPARPSPPGPGSPARSITRS